MDREEIIQKFESLKPWKRSGKRAPHKPLLVLYAIRRLLQDGCRLLPYSEIHENLKKLLTEFGPTESNPRPYYPFWRLRRDGIWEIPDAKKIRETTSGDPFKRDLDRHDVSGGFPENIAHQLQNDCTLPFEIIQSLLEIHFPYSIHEDILQAVKIESPLQISKPQRQDPKQRKRDRNFRANILKAYEDKCAVCGFDAKLGTVSIGLEAAHIKWHTQCGPDVVINGLALCSLHHKLFDRGAFTLSEERELLVSGKVGRSVGSEEWLMRFHGKHINLPQKEDDYPALEFIDWHVNEVFKGNPREL